MGVLGAILASCRDEGRGARLNTAAQASGGRFKKPPGMTREPQGAEKYVY